MNKSFVLGLAFTTLIGITGLCELSAIAAQSGQGQRQQGPPPQGRRDGTGGEGMLFALLDLTSEQKDQIEKIHDAEKVAAQPIHEQLKTIHDQLHAATKDGAFNESVIRSLLSQTQQPELELEILHIKTHTAIFNVLTPAQKAKLIELQAKLEKQHDGPPPPPHK